MQSILVGHSFQRVVELIKPVVVEFGGVDYDRERAQFSSAREHLEKHTVEQRAFLGTRHFECYVAEILDSIVPHGREEVEGVRYAGKRQWTDPDSDRDSFTEYLTAGGEEGVELDLVSRNRIRERLVFLHLGLHESCAEEDPEVDQAADFGRYVEHLVTLLDVLWFNHHEGIHVATTLAALDFAVRYQTVRIKRAIQALALERVAVSSALVFLARLGRVVDLGMFSRGFEEH